MNSTLDLYTCRVTLKPNVCDKRLYGTLPSSLMLIPVTHPTQCVAECANYRISGQAKMTWGPSMEFSGLVSMSGKYQYSILIGVWGLAVQWRLNVGYGPMTNHIFSTQRLVPYPCTDTRNSRTQKFHFGMINIRLRLVPVP